MKLRALLLTAALLLVSTLSVVAFDEDYLNRMTFVNSSGRDIEYIFLSPGDSEYWGPEILGSSRILQAGDSLGFYILYPDECNAFDIMAIDSSGGTLEIYDYEICDGTEEEVEFTKKDLRDDAPDMDFVTIHIQNETIPIYYLFLSPSDSDMWGVDYLDEYTILDSDGTVSFLFPADSDPASYDLMGVDEDMDEYQFSFDVDHSADEGLWAIEISDLQ